MLASQMATQARLRSRRSSEERARRRRPTRPRPLGVTAGLYVLALLAACSGGTPPDEWAGKVCAALSPWRGQIDTLNASAQRQVSAAGSPDQARAGLLELLAGAETATESARAAVAAAGTPDVDGGEEVARRFERALAGTRDAYARARSDLQALPTQDEDAFYDGVVAVLARLGEAYANSAVDTTELDSPRLRVAFDGAWQCR
jgi:hypothetical protein